MLFVNTSLHTKQLTECTGRHNKAINAVMSVHGAESNDHDLYMDFKK